LRRSTVFPYTTLFRSLWGDYAVGMVKDCNWLQHYENIVDPWHLVMLHQNISGDQFQGALMQGAPPIGWEKTPRGVRYKLAKELRSEEHTSELQSQSNL